jgi:hypothetical protein
MTKKSQPLGSGTLIRGADGALYFVADKDKWAVRLPDKYTAEARSLLDKEGFVPKKEELPAFHGSGLVYKESAHDIAIVLNRLAALIRLKKDRS